MPKIQNGDQTISYLLTFYQWGKMVNVTKGILVECDAAMKQLLLHLDETHALGNKFIVQDLDETHVFIAPEYLEVLQSRIDDLMDRISFPLAEREIE
ncbi:general transcription factor IIH subunit 5-like [Daphnia pulex]|uniref:general transcription factor IIH subunit 5-like n=2 Tax=Daphnia TaxID=6668 RepID=UPI001EE0062E|nr:general transcription factor IIH subunit 5-like [Daphnia pulex]